jgi:type I restriction enzyme M protein
MTSVKENISSAANEMLTKIKLNNFENIILALTFYKLLSDQLVQFAKDNNFSDQHIESLDEDEQQLMNFMKYNLSYFIGHKNLFSTWIALGSDFDISHVRDALHAFSRLNPNHTNIFENLQGSLCELGDTASEQTKTISKLIWSIQEK